VDELGLPELTTQQIEDLCTIAENAARKHILAKVPQKGIERLDLSVEAEGTKQLDLNIEIDLVLTQENKGLDSEKIVEEAIREGFKAGENFLRKLT
jgi:hypothetical protein